MFEDLKVPTIATVENMVNKIKITYYIKKSFFVNNKRH